MSTDRRAVRNTLTVLAGVIALAIAAFGVAVAGGHDVNEGSPQDTVRDFLTTSVVDGDGVDACGYLTPAAVGSLSTVEPRAMTCPDALSDTQLTLGGERVDTEAEIKDLDQRAARNGNVARIAISAHGATMTFVLRRATTAERDEADAPATPWRIDSGVNRLAG